MSLEQVRMRAQRFETRIRRRNIREYVASAIVIVVFSAYVVLLPTLLFRVGSALIIPGALVFLYNLRKRAAIRTLPEDLALVSSRDFYRQQLEQQRDAVRTVWLWGLLPFLPGLAIFIMGAYLLPLHGVTVGMGMTVLMTSTFLGVWWLNVRAARRLQRTIDELAG
jgi:hypothetical protein